MTAPAAGKGLDLESFGGKREIVRVPTRSASPRSLVPLLALFALAVILLVAWISQSRREAEQVVTSPRKESGFQEVMSAFATKSEETRRATEIDASAPSSKSTPTTKTGRLRLHVTDAASGAPLAGVACRVYAERNGPVTFGTLTTDDDGLASQDSLPENTILVHVERKPPHASTYAGVWLREGETRDLEVKVGVGGLIVGRVIDDSRRPVADVAVFLPGAEPAQDQPPEVRTSEDGRFEVPCVVSRPRGVWIVDGAMRPASWEPVLLRFAKNETHAWATVSLEDGKRVDIGDVVLERPTRLSGRLLDAQRNPVADAVIGSGTSPEQLRREVLRARNKTRPTGEQKDRTRTRADGSFEIAIRPSFPHLVVATPEGVTQWFTLKDVVAGEPRTDLELILDDVTILELELVDERGARVTKVRTKKALEDVSYAAGFGGGIRVALVFEGGSERSISQRVDEDGLFRIQAPVVRGKKRSLRVNCPGYLPFVADLDAAVGLVDRRQVMLRETPCLKAHLRVLTPKQSTANSPQAARVLVQACMLGPREAMEAIRAPWHECCGLGSTLNTALVELDRDVELPVSSEHERYWIHAVVLQWRPSPSGSGENLVLHESHAGPFAPDATVHAIEIPSLEVSESPANAKSKDTPPSVTLPKGDVYKSTELDDSRVWKTRLRFEESDGRPVPRDTSLTVFKSTGVIESAATGRVLDDGGNAGFAIELTGSSAIHVREHKIDPIIGDMQVVQVIEVTGIESYGSRPIVLATWHPIDVVVRGDAGELPEAALQAQLVMLDTASYVPANHAILLTREAAPLPDRARRFRTWAPAGKYEIRLKSGLFTAPKTEVEVRNQDTLQVFELSSTRR